MNNNLCIQNHSKPDKKYVVFSAYKSNKSRSENEHNDLMVSRELDELNIPWKPLKGKYEGVSEESFIVPFDEFDFICDIAERYGQDNVLILDETEAHGLRKAHLHWLKDGYKQFIGWLKSVSKERAMRSEAYSYCPRLDTYWIVVKEREVFLQRGK